MATISTLNSQAWYRFIKVIYIIALVLILFLANFIVFDGGATGEVTKYFLITNGVILLIFWILRGAFYYIALGDFNPKD